MNSKVKHTPNSESSFSQRKFLNILNENWWCFRFTLFGKGIGCLQTRILLKCFVNPCLRYHINDWIIQVDGQILIHSIENTLNHEHTLPRMETSSESISEEVWHECVDLNTSLLLFSWLYSLVFVYHWAYVFLNVRILWRLYERIYEVYITFFNLFNHIWHIIRDS